MKFSETPLAGAWVIDLDPIADERGYFARTFCEQEFGAHGLNVRWPQMNSSFNRRKATLRGMHYQAAPWAEIKLVRCVRGSIFDVMVDLRPESPTLHRWFGAELSAANGKALYVPEGFAHGFQALADGSEVFYLMSASVEASAARGIRWDDPLLKITWPLKDPILSAKDAALEFIEVPS